MFKIIISLILITLPVLALAQDEENFLCSAFYARPIIAHVEKSGLGDKFKHCSVSCMLTLRCGAIDTYSAGILKEILDLLGMGHAEMADIKANIAGIKVARNQETASDDLCLSSCEKLYP